MPSAAAPRPHRSDADALPATRDQSWAAAYNPISLINPAAADAAAAVVYRGNWSPELVTNFYYSCPGPDPLVLNILLQVPDDEL